MKRPQLRILAALLALGLSFAMVACVPSTPSDTTPSDEATVPDYAGVYTLSSVTQNGVTAEGEQLATNMEGEGGLAEQYIEIVDSKNMVMSMGGQVMDIVYTANGNSLEFLDETGPTAFVRDGNTLTWTVDDEQAGGEGLGFTMIFTK